MAMFLASAFILLGKIVIVLGNCYFCWFLMARFGEHSYAPPAAGAGADAVGEDQTSYFGALVCVALGTYVTAEVTLGMFDETVVALMTCRAVDMDLAGGGESTRFGPPTFYTKFDDLDKKLAEKAARPDKEMGHGTAVN